MWKYCRRSFIWKIKPQDFINRLNWKLEQPFIDSIIHSRSEWGEGEGGGGGGGLQQTSPYSKNPL